MTRLAPGRIRDSIVAYLSECKGSATVQEIIEGVSGSLGRRVPASSVRSYLGLNANGTFTRVERGLYRLEFDDGEQQASYEPAPLQKSFLQPSARLIEGDCLEWLSSQARNSIEAVVTDPPFGILEYTPKEQQKLRAGRGGVWRIPPSFDGHKRSPLPRFTTMREAELASLEQFFTRWAQALLPVLVPGANVVVASNPLVSDRVSRAIASGGLERRGEVVRLVMTLRGGDRPKNAHHEFPNISVMPRSMWEPWLCFRKPLEGRVQDNLRKWRTGGYRRISGERPFGDVIVSHPTRPSERRIAPHPSLKPQSFLRQIVRAILPLGQGTVLDPFAGAGSTLAAATAVGYDSVGIEIDPQFTAIARRAIPLLSQIKI